MSETLSAARSYAARGWPVFPLVRGGKAPLTPNGFKAASADAGTILSWWQKWPDANLGIATGADSDLLVLDVDPRHGGDLTLEALEARLGPLPHTVECLTGGGGRHLFFRYPEGGLRGFNDGRLGAGLDVKGDGGYAVAAPSLHESGKLYSWEGSSEPGMVPLAQLPVAWLEELRAPKERKQAASAAAETFADGSRNNSLTSLAGTMRHRGMSESAILAALLAENRLRCQPPLDEDEVRSIASSVSRYDPAATDQRDVDPFQYCVQHFDATLQGEQAAMWRSLDVAGRRIFLTRLGLLLPDQRDDAPTDPASFLWDEPRNLVRLRTGFSTLDQATRGGIPTGIVTALLGAPHTGKTALASQIAIRAASDGYLVLILFKDEGRFAGVVRLGQQFGLDRSRLENQDRAEIARLAKALLERDIRVPDPDSEDWTLEASIDWLDATAAGGPRLLIVDSIQSAYARCAEDKRSLREEIEAKMRLLEGFAKRGGMVIATSEMNRSAYRNKDEKDNVRGIAAGAESRSIEYVSRLILSLEGDAEKIVAAKVEKNSPGGKRPILRLKFDPSTARFREIQEDEAESIADDARKTEEEVKRAKIREKIRKALRKTAELNVKALEREVGGNKELLADVREEMAEAGDLLMRPDGQSKFYRLPDVQ